MHEYLQEVEVTGALWMIFFTITKTESGNVCIYILSSQWPSPKTEIQAFPA